MSEASVKDSKLNEFVQGVLGHAEIDEVLALLAEAARKDKASSLLRSALKHPSAEVQRVARSWLALPPHQPLGCSEGAVESIR